MNRLTNPSFRWSFVIGLLLCGGCDDGKQPRTNHFAANPVSRSVPAADQRTDPWESISPSRAVRPIEDPLHSRGPAPVPMLSGCRAELKRQKSYPFDFRLTSLGGRTLNKRQFRGRLLIVDIWATWCGPCKREVPHFIELQKKYRDAGLSIVGVNYERAGDDRENRRHVESFARSAGINYPLALGDDSIIGQIENFRGFPTTIFIDGTGQVRLTLRGSRSLEELETFVKILLQDKSITGRELDSKLEPSGPTEPAAIQSNPFAAATLPTLR